MALHDLLPDLLTSFLLLLLKPTFSNLTSTEICTVVGDVQYLYYINYYQLKEKSCCRMAIGSTQLGLSIDQDRIKRYLRISKY